MKTPPSALKLQNDSRVAVIGGGPSGSIFSYFLLDIAERAGIRIGVDIYEHKDFSRCGPRGCNHCGGIISESLVQLLAAEGINLPSRIVQRGIESYVLHMEGGSVRIATPFHEKRIAALHRGAGPMGGAPDEDGSFDGFLQNLVQGKGAAIIPEKVTDLKFQDGRPVVTTKTGRSETYDLLAGAVGINSASQTLFEGLDLGFQTPTATKTYICELQLGNEEVKRCFGSAMHVFLLDIPRLEFAALVPKNEFVTLVMLGNDIDKDLVQSFLSSPEVIGCFPPGWDILKGRACACFPKINVKRAGEAYADRVVLLGDCAVTKLYKNGIGAAYIAAKAAASTAVLHGISKDDFQKHYEPACRSIHYDNLLGKLVFTFTRLIQKLRPAKNGILFTIAGEQKSGRRPALSSILWDTFTGSASYRDIFLRFFNPVMIFNMARNTLVGVFRAPGDIQTEETNMNREELGKVYADGEVIIKQGDKGDCLYVIQSGCVEVVSEENGKEVELAELGENDFFGEIALFNHVVRTNTVRAKGEVRVLTVDKRTLLGRIQSDPSLAFRIIEKLSMRVCKLDEELSHIKSAQ